MLDPASLGLAAAAGVVGGAMNALAGGGTFATMPALLALGTPANIANATSNLALMPGAAASAWSFREELAPVGGVPVRLLAAITFAAALVGSGLLAWTPGATFDVIVPWLLLVATLAIVFGPRAAMWLRERVTIGPRVLVAAQAVLGVYGGYFGGGIGMMMTATYGLLAGASPRSMFAPRTLMLATANFSAAIVFVLAGLVRWEACLPMLAGGIVGGWLGAIVGKRLPPWAVRGWTILVTALTTTVFFYRAYG
ncbi:sulfite exporter TauE/SafE family protein [Sphingomonas mollis]|uniref:Probable membrane transporter protein n=1 Tax=Sphingomonas mollis TaxID=2795726 RepID=A0ABS0XR81_9SPHN|nr:sulfite exporter TauE/SafE family protein [Sphingomonas sp. BT553]MBJ6122537.1 sulfite exporter TauE/SafE family protein [Sphingomonas sp. BT553]